MTKNKRKAIFFLQAGVGGAERMTVLIGKMLDREKFDVMFAIVPKGKVVSSIEDFIPKECRIDILKEASPIGVMRQAYKLMRKEKADVVFSSVLYLNNKVLLLKWLFPRTRFIIRCENYLYTFKKKQRAVVKAIYRMADHIIAQTDEMRQELLDLGINPTKVVTLENPIDTDCIRERLRDDHNPYPKDGRMHYLASGRFAFQKGYDMLVEAFAEILKRENNADLYIIGANTGGFEIEYRKVIDKAHRLGIEERFHCMGFQKNPYSWVRHADCFVLSSRWEGLPNVLIEALYLGTPVAAMKCIPVIGRIVTDGIDGYLAEKESPGSLAVAMEKAVKLGRIITIYRGSQPGDFTRLFEEAIIGKTQ